MKCTDLPDRIFYKFRNAVKNSIDEKCPSYGEKTKQAVLDATLITMETNPIAVDVIKAIIDEADEAIRRTELNRKEEVYRMRQALRDMIEITERDEKGDPDYLPSPTWRDLVLKNAKEAVKGATDE